jgi:hypothetical protein
MLAVGCGSVVLVLAGYAGASSSRSVVDPIADAKASIEAAYASQMANAPTDSRPKDPIAARPSGAPESAAWPQGIFDDPEAPFPAAEYLISNRWQQDIGATHVVAYAGQRGDGSERGVVVILVYSLDLSSVRKIEVGGPPGGGPLKVVSARGHVLTLVGQAGGNVALDIDKVVAAP